MTPGLAEWARTGGLTLTGEGGLLGKLAKMVVEGGLDDHLGYEKNDPAGGTAVIPATATGPRPARDVAATRPAQPDRPRRRDTGAGWFHQPDAR